MNEGRKARGREGKARGFVNARALRSNGKVGSEPWQAATTLWRPNGSYHRAQASSSPLTS